MHRIWLESQRTNNSCDAAAQGNTLDVGVQAVPHHEGVGMQTRPGGRFRPPCL